jgi:hypothetical protein
LSFLSFVDCILGILYGFLLLFLFLANIHLLVSTYHARPFEAELPHSGYFPVPSICLQTQDVLILNI